jgi:hypothetical protein
VVLGRAPGWINDSTLSQSGEAIETHCLRLPHGACPLSLPTNLEPRRPWNRSKQACFVPLLTPPSAPLDLPLPRPGGVAILDG